MVFRGIIVDKEDELFSDKVKRLERRFNEIDKTKR